jgi:MerR family transcriptional regulator, heat shock protein HspR
VTVPSLPFEDEDLPLYTMGQVSGMLEVQQAFLRRLDEFGVVRPSRSDGGQRRYSRREVVTVQYVVQLTGQGVTLAGIRRILELEAQVAQLELECSELQARLRQLLDKVKDA